MKKNSLPPAIFVMGPTASGKTDLAIKLIETLPAEIVSVDSAMVYRDMNIGTAKPDADTLRIAPHRLIDILDPVDSYSAAEFCVDAQREMQTITEEGKIPILVGGTMLYFKALQQGLAPLPSADQQVRSDIEAEASERGWAALHQDLAKIDCVAAERIHPNDPQRIQRALEIYRITGRSISSLQRDQVKTNLPYRLSKLVVAPSDRAVLHQRIADRFDLMLKQGFLDEVRELRKRDDLDLNKPSMRSVGYRQVWQHLNGDFDQAGMREKAIIATRQLAKRQFTWLRSEQGCNWFDSLETDIYPGVLEQLRLDGVN